MPSRSADSTDLFSSLTTEEIRQLSQWSLDALGLERGRRKQNQVFSDEELGRRLAEISVEPLTPDAVTSYRRLQALSGVELERLIEIRGLYKSSSPFASGRIEIYRKIARLAPWDDTCLARISAEYEATGELLAAREWLERALRVNPDNAGLRSRWEQLSETTAFTRRRLGRNRLLGYAALACVAALLVWSAGYRISWDPTNVLAAVKRMEDTQVPADVEPHYLLRHVFTNYERATFKNPHGASYVVLVTSPFRKLKHTSSTARVTNSETDQEVLQFSIRESNAEFIYEKTDRYETVHGYFQGKQYPVSLTALFEFSDRDVYAEGGAPEWIQSLGAGQGPD